MTAASIVVAVVWSRKTATDHIGYVVDVFNVALYSSPLALAWKVGVLYCCVALIIVVVLRYCTYHHHHLGRRGGVFGGGFGVFRALHHDRLSIVSV